MNINMEKRMSKISSLEVKNLITTIMSFKKQEYYPMYKEKLELGFDDFYPQVKHGTDFGFNYEFH